MRKNKPLYAYNMSFLKPLYAHDLSHLKDKRRVIFPVAIAELLLEIILAVFIYMFIPLLIYIFSLTFVDGNSQYTTGFCKGFDGHRSCLDKNLGLTLFIIPLMTLVVRIPWQIPISIFMRCLKKYAKEKFYKGTFIPIIKSYLICYHIFVLSWAFIFILGNEYLYAVGFYFAIGFQLGIPSFSAALLAPYIVYKITGKTLGQRILGN